MPYLSESMESILGQSYSDFEILVINDGSSDDSLEYLNSIRDPRLRLLSQSNQGLTATLNRMLSESRTQWLVRQDADDVSYPHRLSRIAEYIGKHPEAGIFYSLADYYPSTSMGQFRSSRGTPEELRQIVNSGYLLSICHTSVTLNVEKALAVGGYRFNLHVEDRDLWWRMAIFHDIRFIPEATVGFRQTLQSISSVNLEEQWLNGLYVQYLLLSHLWKLEPLPIETVRAALARTINTRQLRSKKHLRAFNMEWGRRNRSKAVLEAAVAFALSPLSLMRRVTDEIASDGRITVGESPKLFASLSSLLWAVDHESTAACVNPRNSVLCKDGQFAGQTIMLPELLKRLPSQAEEK
jgi:glycosyltransferase involved in cell wall biosynthesis